MNDTNPTRLHQYCVAVAGKPLNYTRQLFDAIHAPEKSKDGTATANVEVK